jgi:diguanylate cyclase (GGDEF)-like protein
MNCTLLPDTLLQLVEGAAEAVAIVELQSGRQTIAYVNQRFTQLAEADAAAVVSTDLEQFLQSTNGARFVAAHATVLKDAAGVETHRVCYFHLTPTPDAVPPAEPAPMVHSPAVDSSVAAFDLLASSLPQPRWVREDRLTGLNSRQSFEQLLGMQWQLCQRQGQLMTLLMFEIDSLASYRDTFDRNAVDACVRKLSRLLSTSYRRGSDVLARWDEGAFCVIAQSSDVRATAAYAQGLANRVADMQIHHPRGARGRFLSISVGIASMVPAIDASLKALIDLTTQAVRKARIRPDGNVALEMMLASDQVAVGEAPPVVTNPQ